MAYKNGKYKTIHKKIFPGLESLYWRVLEKSHKHLWRCECIHCGFVRSISETALKCEINLSCIGCHYHSLDLSVYERNGSKVDSQCCKFNSRGKCYFWRTCACGVEGWVELKSIQNPASYSLLCAPCGSKKRRYKPKIQKHILHHYLLRVRSRAKKKELEYDIDTNYAYALFIKQEKKCAITNQSIELVYGGRNQSASLDRIDSDKGYIQGNVQWVTNRINCAKSDMSDDDFFKMCESVYLNYGKNKHNNIPADIRPKTVFLDIDGCLLFHNGTQSQQITSDLDVLPGVVEKISEWDYKGYKIILTTGRKPSTREVTEKQLKKHGIIWDELIMGIGGGYRVLINDVKPSNTSQRTAIAFNLIRNTGLSEVEI